MLWKAFNRLFVKDFFIGLCKFWVKIEVKDYGFLQPRMIYIVDIMNWVYIMDFWLGLS